MARRRYPASRGRIPAPIDVPIALAVNRLLLAVTIRRNGPYLFALDTGGVTGLIDPALARAPNLPVRGKAMLGMAETHDQFEMMAVPGRRCVSQ